MRLTLFTPPFLAIALAMMCGWGQVARAGSSTPHLEQVLARSNRPAPPAYRAVRRMESSLTDAGKRGWLDAVTEYRPGQGLNYEIVGEGGSEYVRNNILRGMLSTEQELLAAGRRLRASLDAANYDFVDEGLTQDGLRQIIMKPMKKSDGIVDGRLFLDPSSQLLTRIEGRLVKSPSFWIRDVDVAWNFAQIGGHLVPVEMISTGHVRLFGRSHFRMVYEYHTVDGRAVNPKVAGIK